MPLGTPVIVLGALVSSAAAAAPEPIPPPDRPNAVQLDLGLAVVGFAYERLVHRRIAVQLEAQIFGTWFGPLVDLPNMSGFGGQIRPSIFLTEDGPRGVYVAPYLRVDRVTTDVDGQKGDAVGFSSGLFVGYSFLLGERVNLRLGAGAQYMSYVVERGGATRAFETLFPALDLVLGYVF